LKQQAKEDEDEEATICCWCCEAGGVAKLLPGAPDLMATLHHDGAGFKMSAVSALFPSSLSCIQN